MPPPVSLTRSMQGACSALSATYSCLVHTPDGPQEVDIRGRAADASWPRPRSGSAAPRRRARRGTSSPRSRCARRTGRRRLGCADVHARRGAPGVPRVDGGSVSRVGSHVALVPPVGHVTRSASQSTANCAAAKAPGVRACQLVSACRGPTTSIPRHQQRRLDVALVDDVDARGYLLRDQRLLHRCSQFHILRRGHGCLSVHEQVRRVVVARLGQLDFVASPRPLQFQLFAA